MLGIRGGDWNSGKRRDKETDLVLSVTSRLAYHSILFYSHLHNSNDAMYLYEKYMQKYFVSS